MKVTEVHLGTAEFAKHHDADSIFRPHFQVLYTSYLGAFVSDACLWNLERQQKSKKFLKFSPECPWFADVVLECFLSRAPVRLNSVFCAGVEEIDPQQDELMWSNPPVFKVQLCLDPSGQPVFNPTFSQVETMAQAVLDGATRTTFDIPRIGTQMMVAGSASNNAGKTSANSVPTMDLDDVQLKTVRHILLHPRPCCSVLNLSLIHI